MLQRELGAARGGFVPARLVSARAARGLKQNQLAEQIGRSPGLLSKWENDAYSHSPEAQDLDLLSQALDVQHTWFFKALPCEGSASFFRSLRTELKSARDRSAAKLLFVNEIFLSLDSLVEFPSVDIPTLVESNDYKHLTLEQIDKIADQARFFWSLGDDPIEDLMTIIENAGVIVGDDFLVSSKLDGVSKWYGERPVMLLAKDKGTGVRRRFDAAHELGHIILHRHVDQQSLKENWQLIEEQAMAFASAFLMPASSFAYAARDANLESLANIKPEWKVSIGAMLMRLRSLNLLEENEARNLWKYYSYRGWRGNEPYDDRIEFESPVNLRSAIDMVVDGGAEDVRCFLASTGLSIKDISDLTGVDAQSLRPIVQRPKLKLVRSAANDG